jgi:hypothetical protein
MKTTRYCMNSHPTRIRWIPGVLGLLLWLGSTLFFNISLMLFVQALHDEASGPEQADFFMMLVVAGLTMFLMYPKGPVGAWLIRLNKRLNLDDSTDKDLD